MKYVIFKVATLYHPVLFADHTSHKQVTLSFGTPISAGFVHFKTAGLPTCFGKSVSLGLEANKEQDEAIIRKWLLDCGTSSFME